MARAAASAWQRSIRRRRFCRCSAAAKHCSRLPKRSSIASRAGATVIVPNPFYQIYEGAALLAGATPHCVNSLAANGFAPQWRDVGDAVWARTQLVYVCSPDNPTGRVANARRMADAVRSLRSPWLRDRFRRMLFGDLLRRSAILRSARSRRPRRSDASGFPRLVVFGSLSKRSNCPGLRSGYVAGDAALIKAFLLYRTYHGSAMSPAVAAASIAAWNDEAHVRANRALYAHKFAALAPRVDAVLTAPMPEAAFYLWANVGGDDADFARRLYAEQAVSVLPGSYLGRTRRRRQPGSRLHSHRAGRRIRRMRRSDRPARPVRAQRLDKTARPSPPAPFCRGRARPVASTEAPAPARVQSAAMATMSTSSGAGKRRVAPALAGFRGVSWQTVALILAINTGLPRSLDRRFAAVLASVHHRSVFGLSIAYWSTPPAPGSAAVRLAAGPGGRHRDRRRFHAARPGQRHTLLHAIRWSSSSRTASQFGWTAVRRLHQRRFRQPVFSAQIPRGRAPTDAAQGEAERNLLSKQAVEAQLKLMQAQVEPHFLFNTLASVQFLTETDPPQGRADARAPACLPARRAAAVALGQLDPGPGDRARAGLSVDHADAHGVAARVFRRTSRIAARGTLSADAADVGRRKRGQAWHRAQGRRRHDPHRSATGRRDA